MIFQRVMHGLKYVILVLMLEQCLHISSVNCLHKSDFKECFYNIIFNCYIIIKLQNLESNLKDKSYIFVDCIM